jgi:hypothetical protein
MFNEKDINRDIRNKVISVLKGPVKKDIANLLREEFTKFAKDYETFLTPVSDLEKSPVDEWVSYFMSSFEEDYDACISSLKDYNGTLQISFIDNEKLGFNSDSIDSPIHWVYFYINGQRYNSFFISLPMLEAFLDTTNLSSANPAVKMVQNAIDTRIGEFGDGFLVTPFEFNSPNKEFEDVRWVDLFTEEQVTPQDSGESHKDFIEKTSSEIENIIDSAISETLSNYSLPE